MNGDHMKQEFQASVVGHYVALQSLKNSPFPVAMKYDVKDLTEHELLALRSALGETSDALKQAFIRGWNTAVKTIPKDMS